MNTNRKILVLLSVLCMLVACKTTKVNTAESMDTQRHDLVGGYTEYRELDDNDRQLFESTYTDKRKLTPQRVASCVVAGLKYRFVCVDKRGREVVVVIFQPLPGRGEPRVVKVE